MGKKAAKATRKFAASGQLKKTIQQRRKHQDIKRKAERKKGGKGKQRETKYENEDEDEEKDEGEDEDLGAERDGGVGAAGEKYFHRRPHYKGLLTGSKIQGDVCGRLSRRWVYG